MHIVHVGKYYPPYRGGIETVVEELCRGLVRQGATVTALVSNDGPQTVEEHIDGVRVLRLGRKTVINSQPFNLDLIATLRSLRYDVLHVHTPNPLGALAVLMAHRREPLIASHHSDIVRQRILGAPATAAHALLYQRAAAVVAATPKHIQHSPILRFFQARSRVIHYPIDPEPYAAAPDAWDEDLPLQWQTGPLVLFVGRLVYYKGVDILLKAISLTDHTRLAIVGVGPLKEQLERDARAFGIGERVAFLGALSGARLRSLYKRSQFLVLPSVAPSEAFGMVQLEAMAAARPVISTDLKSGVPYVNQHMKTGLVVPPGDAPALASAIKLLIDDEAYAKHLGSYAQMRVMSEFHVDRIVEAHLDLYQTAVSGRSPRCAF